MSVRQVLLSAIRHVSIQMDHTIVPVVVDTSVTASQNVEVIDNKVLSLYYFIYLAFVEPMTIFLHRY